MGNRTYQGRFKGSTDTHLPNDKSKKGHDAMNWPSYVVLHCEECGYRKRIHKLEVKIYSCPVCSGDQDG